MKICWDNLEELKFIKNGTFRKVDNTYYLKVCETCGEEFLGVKRAKVCTYSCRKHSKETRQKLSKANSGENHPNHGKKASEETKRKMSKTQAGKTHTEESKLKMSILHKGKGNPMYSMSGELCPSWKGGISQQDYCPVFYDEEYKQDIRDRDGNICLNCGKTEEQNGRKLDVHHIDYDKQNCPPKNLVTVCTSCNSQANFEREWHTSWYQAMLKNRYNYKY